MKHSYRNALYIMLCLIVSGFAYAIQDEALPLSIMLYIPSVLLLISTFFQGISDSVKEGIERANKENNENK